jgi:PAS domain S-box-containing protein
LEYIFHSVLKNSLEAIDDTDPRISIKTTLDKETPHYLQIQIFNTGNPPKEEYMDKIFAPFFSTKTTGTGFGLPIAQLALRKNYGQINIKPMPLQGTLVIISLPLPDFCDYPLNASAENGQLEHKSERSHEESVSAIRAYTYSVEMLNGSTLTTHRSPGCISITGYAPEDYDSDPHLWYKMIYPDDRPCVQSVIDDLLSGREVSPFEHRLIRRDGVAIWVRNTLVPFYDIDKRLFKYEGIIEDITNARAQARTR